MDDDFELPDENVVEEELDDYEEDLEGEIEDEETEPDDVSNIEDIEAVEEVEGESEFIKLVALNIEDSNHRIIRVRPDHEKITSEIIQVSEMVEAIGIRASQIENGAPVFTDVSGLSDPIEMAKKEFFDRQNPLILQRALQTSLTEIIVEHWKVREMEFPRNLYWKKKIITDIEMDRWIGESYKKTIVKTIKK
jgi:DNA-directed RNA polymerase subunit K/omega